MEMLVVIKAVGRIANEEKVLIKGEVEQAQEMKMIARSALTTIQGVEVLS